MKSRFKFKYGNNVILPTIVVLMTVCFAVSGAYAAYPDRPITLVCPWGAGGGTDTVARALAAGMEKELGQPVNVVNHTGGSGIIGHSAFATNLEDLGKLGFGHHGIGSNYAIGGSVAAPCHIDIIYAEASLYVDGKLILDKGELLI